MVAAPRLKALPKVQEQAFIDTARRIFQKELKQASEIPDLPPRFKEKAEALLDATTRRDNFLDAYDALSIDDTALKDWRKMIATTAPPEQEPLTRPYEMHPVSYFKNLPKRQWGIDKLMYDRGTSAFVGDGGSGKSALMLDAMLCRAYGVDFLGRPVKQGFIVWVAAESIDEIYPRVYAWQLHNKIDLEQEPQIMFIDEHMPFNNSAEVESFIESIKAQAEEMHITVDGFVFDTYARCTPGADENNTQETKIILAAISTISQEFHTHVSVIHHTNTRGSIRGSTVFKNDLDTVWIVSKDSGTIKMTCEKMRGAETPAPFSLKMISQILSDENADDTAPVVVLAEGVSESFTPHAQLQILEILQVHVQLSCNAWAKHCKEAYKIAESTFYGHIKRLKEEGMIDLPGEKVKGKTLYYSITQKGLDSLG